MLIMGQRTMSNIRGLKKGPKRQVKKKQKEI